ncbi:MAG: hypothetical protein ABSH35_23015 [Isosphaeraceae bacterium]
MGRAMGKWTTGLLIVAATSWATAIRAAEPRQGAESPQEEILKKNGLKALGPIYVLEAESDVKQKVSEVKLLSKQWNHARLQQQSILSAKDHQAMIQGLTGQVNQLRAELNTVNQQMRSLPRYRGRLANNYAQEAYAELLATRNQLNVTLTQQNMLLGQVRSQPADPKLKQKVDDEAQAKHDEYVQAVHDLSQLVTTTKDKYAALAKNNEVTKALAGLDPAIKPRPQLGPSHEFHETVKLADRLEKEAAQSPAEPKAKAAVKSKRGVNSSRTAPDS